MVELDQAHWTHANHKQRMLSKDWRDMTKSRKPQKRQGRYDGGNSFFLILILWRNKLCQC